MSLIVVFGANWTCRAAVDRGKKDVYEPVILSASTHYG